MEYYRFNTGTFIKAESFQAAKTKYVEMILAENEDKEQWHECTCLGFQHRHSCPSWEEPF